MGDIKMTYKESYQQLGSLEEIIEEAKRDINIAGFINLDRIEVIVNIYYPKGIVAFYLIHVNRTGILLMQTQYN
jgi:hypothetical protein